MMKLSLGVGKIVSIVKVTTDKNAKIANSSVTSYTISLFVEIFENQPNPGIAKIEGWNA